MRKSEDVRETNHKHIHTQTNEHTHIYIHRTIIKGLPFNCICKSKRKKGKTIQLNEI